MTRLHDTAVPLLLCHWITLNRYNRSKGADYRQISRSHISTFWRTLILFMKIVNNKVVRDKIANSSVKIKFWFNPVFLPKSFKLTGSFSFGFGKLTEVILFVWKWSSILSLPSISISRRFLYLLRYFKSQKNKPLSILSKTSIKRF